MTKRKKFIISAILLSFGFLAIQFLPQEYRYYFIFVLTLFNIIALFWALKENLRMDMTLLSLILPVLFTLGVGLFWFLLPANIYARLPVVILYGVGLYVLFLTENIFSVSAIRTIALLRAARGVGFVLTLATSFFLFNSLLSFKAPIYINTLFSFLISLPLFYQGLWIMTLDEKPDKKITLMTLVFSLIVLEVSAVLFIWPVSVIVGSLFLTVTHYLLLGIGQSELEGKLFPQVVREYVSVGIFVILGMILATKWGA